MDLLEVYTPEIQAYVRYKRLSYDDVDAFVEEYAQLKRDDYVKQVLDTVVFNLRSEISGVLRTLEKEEARTVLSALYNGAVMLNPGLDVDQWVKLSFPKTLQTPKEDEAVPAVNEIPPPIPEQKAKKRKPPTKRITKAKFLGLEDHLRANIIGQNEAVSSVVKALKRTVAGLGDDERPLGVFLFAGASGVGKTELAKQLNSYLFGQDVEIVRIDCGEYQHKHENQKLIGSPPGYVGHDEGGHLTNQMAKNPHTVVLLDEVEKAHPDMWNTFLRVFDEGIITDGSGKQISFRNSIIVMTTNLGNKEAVSSITGDGLGFNSSLHVDFREAAAPKRESLVRHTEKAIRKHFRPEFLNRIDRTVVFNHLTGDDLTHIAQLELSRLESKLKKKGVSFTYDPSVTDEMIRKGVNPIEGARGLARVRREHVEDIISDRILHSTTPRGSVVSLSFDGQDYIVDIKRPKRKRVKAAE